jgi:hypothetical protein
MLNLEPTTVFLQQNPFAYRSFGPFWWWLKKQIKARYGTKTLAWLGKSDDPAATAILRQHYPTDQAMFEGAMNHCAEKIEWGETALSHSELPDGTGYDLYDPDCEALEAVNLQH